MEEKTYLIMRFHFDSSDEDNRRVLYKGLTLEQAQAHCSEDYTREENARGDVVWFDAYEEE